MHRDRTAGQDLDLAAVVWLGYAAPALLISCLAGLSLPSSANGPRHLGYAGTAGLLLGFGVIMGLVGVWTARMSWAVSMYQRFVRAPLHAERTSLPRSRWALFVILYGSVLLVGSEAYYVAFQLPLTANVMGCMCVFIGANGLVLARNIQAFEQTQRRSYYWRPAPRRAFGRWSLVYVPAE